MAWLIGWGFLDVFLRYRFLDKMLGARFRYAYVWFWIGNFVYGQMNARFSLAVTVGENLLYLCGCGFLLNVFLFHGSAVKKAFFTLWIYCAAELVANGLLIFFHGMAVADGRRGCSETAMDILGITACMIQYLMMEILQRKLYLLKRDFTDKNAVSLLCVIVFIYAAVSKITDLYSGISDWPGGTALAAAVPCSLIAFGGAALHVYVLVKLEAGLLERLAGQQYQLMGRHLETVKEQYELTMKMRHDIRNHGLCLAQLLSDGKIEEASDYLEQLNIQIEQGKPAVQTGSAFADALLNPKYRRAREQGIDIRVSMKAPEKEQIAPVDLCCLLANALDNAVEACGRRSGKDKGAGWIRLKAGAHGNYWIMEIQNSIFIPVICQDGKYMSSKRNQACGTGIKNIKTIVERYEGVLDIQCDSYFSLSVMLALPPAAKKKPPAS